MAVSSGGIEHLSEEKSTRLEQEINMFEQITYMYLNTDLFARTRYLFTTTHNQSFREKKWSIGTNVWVCLIRVKI